MDLLRAILIGSLLATACGGESRAPVQQLHLPTSEALDSLGRLSDSTRAEVFSRIKDASLSPSGRFFAVSDEAPPYLRILDRVERTISSFGNEGPGPGELRGVHAVDFEGDSVLLVLAAGRLERFSVDGEWLGGESLSRRRIHPMSFAMGCGDRLFVYGAPVEHRELDSVPWLHEVDQSASSLTTPVLVIPGRAGGSVRYGALYGVDGTDDGIFVWHIQVQSGVEAGYWIACDGSEPILLEHTAGSVPAAEAFLVGGRQVLALTLPDTLFAGAAAIGAGAAFRAFSSQNGDEATTSIRTIGSSGCELLEIVGDWRLYDAERGLLVLARQEPFPSAILVDSEWIRSNSVQRACNR